MTLQYEQPSINQQQEQGLNTFIFDSSISWASLLTIMSTVEGKKEIIFVDTLSTIPPGTYDMTDITLLSNNEGAIIIVSDAILNNLDGLRNVTLNADVNSSPSLVYNSGTLENLLIENSGFGVILASTAPLISVTGGTSLVIRNLSSVYTTGNPAVPVIAITGSSSVVLTSSAGTGGNHYGGPLGSDAFATIEALSSLLIFTGTGDIWFPATLTPAGTLITSRIDDYDEAVLANWSGTAPLNVKNALDRIAAAVGPIA